MRVVCVSAECEPWAKTGGLGDVVDALARAVGTGRPGPLAEVEPPVDVFLPKYRGMKIPDTAAVRRLSVPDPAAPGGSTSVNLVEFEARGYRVRLVDHPPAFDRDDYYGGPVGDYPDNGWRFGLLCRTALEALRADDRPVDVLHLHDWQAMVAAVLRDVAYRDDPGIGRAAVVATIHNLAYQGWIGREAAKGMLFPAELTASIGSADGILLLREGISRAELSNTVSPGYAAEVLRPEFGMGMDGVLRGLGDRFGGIINGLDMAVWDPATDDALPARYERMDRAGKAECRRALLSELAFDPHDDGPLFGLIGRLDPQKGFDLLADATPAIVAAGGRIVAEGTGDPKMAAGLRHFAAAHPRQVALIEKFDRALARRIYAGADFFVMPSRFEPCGQGQMIAMRYGTPPVVHRTGGLADTVVDVDERPDDGTGFVFGAATPEALAEACRRAIARHRAGGPAWDALVDRGMAIDWSWESGPAERYVASYRRAISLRRER